MKRILTLVFLLFCFHSAVIDNIVLSSQKECIEGANQRTEKDPLIVSEPKNHAEWRAAITSGLTSIPKKFTPGQAIAFGMNVAVVAVGDCVNDILIVAGQVGKGRVVVATHTDYANNFTNGDNPDLSIRTLQTNIKTWATKGIYLNSSSVMEAVSFLKSTNKTLLGLVKILYFTEGVNQWTQDNRTSILNFVKNGGALFVSATPWGWSQVKKSNNFNLMLTYKTLVQAGIAFTGNYITGSQTFYFNKPTYLSHLGIEVDIILSPKNTSFNYTKTIKIIEQVQFLNAENVTKFQQRIRNYLTSKDIYQISPSSAFSTASVYKKAKILCYQRFLLNGDLNIAAPNHEYFPGAVDRSASKFAYVTRDFTLTAPGFQQYHHTGLYAVAGQPITIEVLNTSPKASWTVSIGFHYDNDVDHQQWVRWPKIYTKKDLAKKTTFSCGFGGLIVLESPAGANETITIRVSSAVEAPWYDSQNITSVSDWPVRKHAPGAWGCAVGKWVGFCMPRKAFNKVDPLQILNTYDKIWVEYHGLRGSKPENQRKIYIISDIDPSAGQMHAGYPIVTSTDVIIPCNQNFQFNYTYLTTQGHWGFFHEIGHNMQRDWWTPSGTREVTVNIFSLKATQLILGKSPKYAPWLIEQKATAKNYLINPNYNTWKNKPEVALFIYAQVIEDYGWNAMKNVLSSYETGKSATYPTTEQGIIDFFWSKYSLEVKVDLSNLLKKWAVPFTKDFTSKVVGLPAYVEKVNLFGN